jgi:hypothetical protein
MEVPDRDPEASERRETLDAHAVGGGRLRAERGAAEERERETSHGPDSEHGGPLDQALRILAKIVRLNGIY